MTVVWREQSPAKRKFFGTRLKLLMGIVLTFLTLATIIIFGFITYTWRDVDSWVVRVIPFPLAIVNNRPVWYRDVLLYSKLNDDEKSDSLAVGLQFAVRRELVASMVRQYDVVIGSDLVPPEDDAPSASGMSERDYDRLIIKPWQESAALDQVVYTIPELQGVSRARAQAVIDDVGSGITFIDLARQYSDEPSRERGGDAGWLTSETVPAGLESILTFEIDETSGILETERHFVIAQVYDAKIDEETVEPSVAARLIYIRKANFAEALEEFTKISKIKYLSQLP